MHIDIGAVLESFSGTGRIRRQKRAVCGAGIYPRTGVWTLRARLFASEGHALARKGGQKPRLKPLPRGTGIYPGKGECHSPGRAAIGAG